MSVRVPLSATEPLIVYVDIKSPYAYVAIEPTLAVVDELNVAVDWRPFTLDIPSYLGSARLDKQGKVVEQNRTAGQWRGVKYAYKDARRYAALQNRVLRGTEKIWDSSLAGIGLLWAKAQGETIVRSYLNAVYEPFWRRDLDIEDPEVVARTLAGAGALVDGFDAYLRGPGRTEHDRLQAEAFAAGVFGVPTYVVAGEMFFGREHLPVIAWLLGGERGPPPDIAYAVGSAS